MPDNHTSMMFQWRRQVGEDRQLKPFDFRVAYAVAERVFRDTGCARISQAAIAADVGATIRGVQNALYRLAERRHLQVEDNSKSGRINRYWPIIRADTESEAAVADEPGGMNGGSFPLDSTYELPFVGGTNGSSGEVRTAVRTEHLISSEASDSHGHARDLKAEFEQWYAIFPKHKARGEAERAYRRARSQGVTADVLIAGAKRYAEERAGQDAKYTKHPGTWLNGKCWLDEHESQTVAAEPNHPELTSMSMQERMARAAQLARTGKVQAKG
jgi:hypothetical protein